MPTVTLNPEIDIYVDQGLPTTNFNATNNLSVGFSAGATRSWGRWNLATIPAGSTINSAKVTPYFYFEHHTGYDPDVNMEIARCTDITWTNAITWNTAPNGACAAATTSILISSGTPRGGAPSDITGLAADVSAALSTGKITYRLKFDDETSPFQELIGSIRFGSPKAWKLTVDYTAPSSNTNFLVMF